MKQKWLRMPLAVRTQLERQLGNPSLLRFQTPFAFATHCSHFLQISHYAIIELAPDSQCQRGRLNAYLSLAAKLLAEATKYRPVIVCKGKVRFELLISFLSPIGMQGRDCSISTISRKALPDRQNPRYGLFKSNFMLALRLRFTICGM